MRTCAISRMSLTWKRLPLCATVTQPLKTLAATGCMTTRLVLSLEASSQDLAKATTENWIYSCAWSAEAILRSMSSRQRLPRSTSTQSLSSKESRPRAPALRIVCRTISRMVKPITVTSSSVRPGFVDSGCQKLKLITVISRSLTNQQKSLTIVAPWIFKVMVVEFLTGAKRMSGATQ